jgi:tetratricopeptide (TPR) repeat protein
MGPEGTGGLSARRWLLAGLAAVSLAHAAAADLSTLTFLERRAAANPLDSVALAHLSFQYTHALRSSGNLEYLQRAQAAARGSLQSVPAERNPQGLLALATALYESHRFKEALQLAQQARNIDPENRLVALLIGDAQFELGDYTAADQTYAKLRTHQSDSALLTRQARLSEVRGKTDAAIGMLSELVAAGNDSLRVRLYLSELHFDRGDFVAAQAQLAAASQVHPDSYAVLEHWAELRAAQGQLAAAAALYNKVITRVPRPDLMHALGDLYALMNRADLARHWRGQAMAGYLQSTSQGNARFYHQLTSFFCDSVPNREQALHWARADLLNRNSVFAHAGLAWALHQDGQYQAAAQAMDRALAHGTRTAELLSRGGLIYSSAGQMNRARQLLQEARVINPRYDGFRAQR